MRRRVSYDTITCDRCNRKESVATSIDRYAKVHPYSPLLPQDWSHFEKTDLCPTCTEIVRSALCPPPAVPTSLMRASQSDALLAL